MNIAKKPIIVKGIKYLALENGENVGRATLYFICNDLHVEPSAFVEDVFVPADQRKKGIGTMLVEQLIHDAQATGCYKVIACSRFERLDVHDFYEKMGFKKHGFEFRLESK
jgi:GNAT superfamily N-acetyltransferase